MQKTGRSHDIGIKESDTGLAHPGLWDLQADKQMMHEEQPLQVMSYRIPNLSLLLFPTSFLMLKVARCTKIITEEKEADTK